MEPADTTTHWVETPSGARLELGLDVVVKHHHARTRHAELAARLGALDDPQLAELFVPPLSRTVGTSSGGRLTTTWPHVRVLHPADPDGRLPWAEAGRLLARLHTVAAPNGLPPHGAPERMRRAHERATQLPESPDAHLLRNLGGALLREVTRAARARERAQRHTSNLSKGQGDSVVHGDWHLGQLGLWERDWRLLDIDDLGVGDPAWDLARPAGFWAAGLLDDASWETFLDAYRDAGGPAVPATGDPWARLDLPARCAVFVAAVRELRTGRPHSGEPARELLAACRQM